MSWLLRSLLAVAMLAGLASAWDESRRTAGVDFYQFRAVGWTAWTSEDEADLDIYSDEVRLRLGTRFLRAAQQSGASRAELGAAQYRSVFETYSTPFLYTAFGVFGIASYDVGLRGYQLLSLAGLVFGVLVLCRLLGYRPEESMAAVLIFSAWFAPFTSDLRVANVNSLQLALLAGYLAVRNQARAPARLWLCGVILGLGVMFKPNLAVVVGVLMFSRLVAKRNHGLLLEAAGIGSGAAAALILSSWCFGSSDSWHEWARALAALPADIVSIELGNVALSRLIQDWIQLDLGPLVVALVVGLAVTAIWMGRTSDPADPGGGNPAISRESVADAAALGLGCMVMLLASRLAWLHYMVLAIPLALVLLRPRAESRASPRTAVVGLAVVGLAASPLLALGVVGSSAGIAGVVCGGALLLFALGLREVAVTS